MQPAPAPTATETGAVSETGSDTGTPTTGDQNPTTGATDNGGLQVGVGAGGSVTTTEPVTVTYTDSGFSPKTVNVKVGQAVTFVNQSSHPMWVASDPHPLHNGYDGTTRDTHCAASYTGPKPFDECSTATSFTFTFTKAGTWGYHNHAVDEDAGTVVVSQ
jgi:plastocyanin